MSTKHEPKRSHLELQKSCANKNDAAEYLNYSPQMALAFQLMVGPIAIARLAPVVSK